LAAPAQGNIASDKRMKQQIAIKLDTQRLDFLRGAIPGRAEDILDVGARNIETRAKLSMKGGGSPHVPSAPGEPPHVDTGALRASIHVEKPKTLARDIMDGVEYGVYLEFGTSSPRMAARPWLTPAVEQERQPLSRAWEQLCE